MKWTFYLGIALGLTLISPNTYAKNSKNPVRQSAFICENGDTATLRYLDENTVELALKYDNKAPKKVQLKRARSGSGELYRAKKGFFGYGAEWHEKDGEANLTYNTKEGELSMPCQLAEEQERPNHTETGIFECENGDRLRIVYLGQKGIDIALTYDVGEPQTARLKPAKSGSGSRFVTSKGFFGYGAEWHEKKGQGYLSYKDEDGDEISMVCTSK
ncbi:MAG: MliC family protein [Cardiobacteriaceae bacterium]|nr:MliC family protein [Cardiobacteriaceae bacterium]